MKDNNRVVLESWHFKCDERSGIAQMVELYYSRNEEPTVWVEVEYDDEPSEVYKYNLYTAREYGILDQS